MPDEATRAKLYGKDEIQPVWFVDVLLLGIRLSGLGILKLNGREAMDVV
jgi:hypothetical protein